MPAQYFVPEDPCACHVTICNPGPDALSRVPLFVVLEVFGSYYFAPTFSSMDYYYYVRLEPGPHEVIVLDTFSWPGGVGTAWGITWCAAITDPEMSEIIGRMDTWSFGWGN